MGIRGSVVVVLGLTGIVVVVLGCRVQLNHLGEIELVLGSGLLHRLVDRGLETLEVDDQVGLLQAGDLLWGQLQIMRFLARQRQVRDAHLVTTHLGGGVFEWIEGDGDLGGARACGSARTVAGGIGGRGVGDRGARSAGAERQHHDGRECKGS